MLSVGIILILIGAISVFSGWSVSNSVYKMLRIKPKNLKALEARNSC